MLGFAAHAVMSAIGNIGRGYPDDTPYFFVSRDDEAHKATAAAKRARKASALADAPYRPIVPTNSPGAEFARAEIRRMDRRAKAKQVNEGSAKAAKARHNAKRGDAPAPRSSLERRSEARKLSPVPADFFGWPRAKRRAWANEREVERQRMLLSKIVRRGVPEAEAKIQFGSL